MKKMLLLAGVAILIATSANAQFGYSNICRAPSGDFWVYPVYDAQPIGSPCTILPTGEWGVVTAD